MCGGTVSSQIRHHFFQGLSPRVRGNHSRPASARSTPRSIPACAGEPRAAGRRGWGVEVYPRVCGGTTQRRLRPVMTSGLSPRVRGNRKPADELRARTVYPRVCGGTVSSSSVARPLRGLSPRVRGNRTVKQHLLNGDGSIPRVCGGTLRGAITSYLPTRSIPACAGEPPLANRCPHSATVYPRVCGGTIPHAAARYMAEVYPRVCGGTPIIVRVSLHPMGLSPRVRGNHLRLRRRIRSLRSIPACAGEPCAKW